MLLQKLGLVPAPTETPEEREEILAAFSKRVTRQRRLSLTPGLVAWLWDDEDELRERARDAVARWHKREEKSDSANRTAGPPERQRRRIDPYKVAFDRLSRSGCPEDLAEFRRRILLFRRLVREEAARQGFSREDRGHEPTQDKTSGPTPG